MIGDEPASTRQRRGQGRKVRSRLGSALGAHRLFDTLEALDAGIELLGQRLQILHRARREQRTQLSFIDRGSLALRWRDLSTGHLDVADGERTELGMRENRCAAHAIDHRHAIREAAESVAPQDRVVIDARKDLIAPVGQPLSGNRQRSGEFSEALGAHDGSREVRQEAEVLALLQSFQGSVADLAPVRLGGQRRRLAKEPVAVERGQELRVFEILTARMLGHDGLKETGVRDRHASVDRK